MWFDLFGSYWSYLYLPQAALTIWMLYDAYQRRADFFWYWIILLVQPIGAWAYFIIVKARDFRALKAFAPRERKASLEELRYRATETPTLTNHLSLAERLVEKGQHAEATPHLQEVLAKEPQHCQALYLQSQCHVAA